MKLNEKTTEQIGMVAVDAGLLMVGDPCYAYPANEAAREFPKKWSEVCSQIKDKDIAQLNFKAGHAGLAVIIGGFGGDGCYPVFIEKDADGRPTALIVRFDK
jgi:hypothetical protein